MGIQVFKGLAQQRSRLLGQVKRLESRIEADKARIETLLRKVAAFDEVLREQGVDIDPDQSKSKPHGHAGLEVRRISGSSFSG